jgi:hypothetical protein
MLHCHSPMSASPAPGLLPPAGKGTLIKRRTHFFVAGRCGLKLQFTWQYVDARYATCLDLELVYGVPSLQGANRGPGLTLGEAANPQVGPIFGAPLSYLELFSWQSTASPWEVPELVIQECPTPTLRNINGGPLEGAEAEGPEASTINTKKHRRRASGGARAGGSVASTINAKKRQRWALGRYRRWRCRSAHHQR